MMTFDDWLDVLTDERRLRDPEMGWHITQGGTIRTAKSECPLCALANLHLEDHSPRKYHGAFPQAVREAFGDEAFGKGAILIARVADTAGHPARPRLLLALGLTFPDGSEL